MSVGILIVRALVGLTVAAHGAQKLFGVFGGNGISGTTQLVESLGFRRARALAYVLGMAELAGGTLFALGLLTPVAALTIVAVMTAAATTVHWKNGFFAMNGGFELPFVIGAVAAAVAFSGPGRYSLDALLELSAGGNAIALGAVALGITTGLAVAGVRNLPEKIPFRRTQMQG